MLHNDTHLYFAGENSITYISECFKDVNKCKTSIIYSIGFMKTTFYIVSKTIIDHFRTQFLTRALLSGADPRDMNQSECM